jgi:hypothetical protein
MKLFDTALFDKYVSKSNLNIRSVTWTRDSHGLFDYESNSVT